METFRRIVGPFIFYKKGHRTPKNFLKQLFINTIFMILIFTLFFVSVYNNGKINTNKGLLTNKPGFEGFIDNSTLAFKEIKTKITDVNLKIIPIKPLHWFQNNTIFSFLLSPFIPPIILFLSFFLAIIPIFLIKNSELAYSSNWIIGLSIGLFVISGIKGISIIELFMLIFINLFLYLSMGVIIIFLNIPILAILGFIYIRIEKAIFKKQFGASHFNDEETIFEDFKFEEDKEDTEEKENRESNDPGSFNTKGFNFNFNRQQENNSSFNNSNKGYNHETGETYISPKRKEYYEKCDILGVDYDLELIEIKKEYRVLAKKYHPDLNPNDDTTEMFQKINDAYEFISDNYDKLK